MQQIIFTGNLDRPGNSLIVFVSEETKKNNLKFLQGTRTLLQNQLNIATTKNEF